MRGVLRKKLPKKKRKLQTRVLFASGKKTIGGADQDVLVCGPSIILLTRESVRAKKSEG